MIALVLINLFLVIFDVVFFLVLLFDDLDYALGRFFRPYINLGYSIRFEISDLVSF